MAVVFEIEDCEDPYVDCLLEDTKPDCVLDFIEALETDGRLETEDVEETGLDFDTDEKTVLDDDIDDEPLELFVDDTAAEVDESDDALLFDIEIDGDVADVDNKNFVPVTLTDDWPVDFDTDDAIDDAAVAVVDPKLELELVVNTVVLLLPEKVNEDFALVDKEDPLALV